MFVALISFRGTFNSFWGPFEVSEQSLYKVLTYEIVNPTFKINLFFDFVKGFKFQRKIFGTESAARSVEDDAGSRINFSITFPDSHF